MIIRVGIVDEHPVIVNGLLYMLHSYPYIKVEFALTDSSKLPDTLQATSPDVLLMDVAAAGEEGDCLFKHVNGVYPDIRLLAMAGLQASFHVKQVFRHGAAGYLLKNMNEDELLTAIETVYEGRQYVDGQVKTLLLDELLSGKRKMREKDLLTRRETEVLELIAREFSSREIADKLFVSLRTVDTHRFNIIQKLQVKNAAGLIKEAYRRGLV